MQRARPRVPRVAMVDQGHPPPCCSRAPECKPSSAVCATQSCGCACGAELLLPPAKSLFARTQAEQATRRCEATLPLKLLATVACMHERLPTTRGRLDQGAAGLRGRWARSAQRAGCEAPSWPKLFIAWRVWAHRQGGRRSGAQGDAPHRRGKGRGLSSKCELGVCVAVIETSRVERRIVSWCCGLSIP